MKIHFEVPKRLDLLTALSVIGLALGFLLGTIASRTQNDLIMALIPWVEPIGLFWARAFALLVLPLVVSFLVLAVDPAGGLTKIGRLGGLSLLVFASLFLAGAGITIVSAYTFLDLFEVDKFENQMIEVFDPAGEETLPLQTKREHWIDGIMPPAILNIAASGIVFPMALISLAFGLALRTVRAELREPLTNFFRAVAETSLVLVRWLLMVMPLGAFALTLTMSSQSGAEVAGIVGIFILLVCVLLVFYTILLYPITALVGQVGIRRFAWGILPAQGVAVATRSSLGSLPALLNCAQQRLRLSSSISGFVLPFAVSIFKVNMSISSTLRFILLCHVYGIDLSWSYLGFFVLSVMVVSMGSPGIPSGSSLITLPLYLSVGIPVEIILIFKAVDGIPDIFKTLLNVTADSSAAAIANRFLGEATET